jgi:hypothetical protein
LRVFKAASARKQSVANSVVVIGNVLIFAEFVLLAVVAVDERKKHPEEGNYVAVQLT